MFVRRNDQWQKKKKRDCGLWIASTIQHMVCQCQNVVVKISYGKGHQIVWNTEVKLLLIGNSTPHPQKNRDCGLWIASTIQHMVCQCRIVMGKIFYGVRCQIVWNTKVKLSFNGNSTPPKNKKVHRLIHWSEICDLKRFTQAPL